jgi:hypothetical protein
MGLLGLRGNNEVSIISTGDDGKAYLLFRRYSKSRSKFL